MSVYAHTHFCQNLDSVQVAARRDDDADAHVYVTVRVGNHAICISGERDEVTRLIQRMQDAVAVARAEGRPS